jgi:hypothetical protein
MMAPSVRLHAAVSGALGAGVDAEDSHPSALLGMTLSLSPLGRLGATLSTVEGSKGHASDASISFSSMSKFAQTCWTSS